MANPDHLDVLNDGVEAWNRWRQRPLGIKPDLSGAKLRSQTPRIGMNLRNANLRGADLFNVDLSEVDLCEADLTDACLFGVNLNSSDLTKAKLCGADLRQANLNMTRLGRADFTGAKVQNTVFTDIDLSEVRGLGAVLHDGPSSIGIDTIYRSKGKIPQSFLRGAGVPDALIGQMVSLAGTGFEFYSLFISYSAHDQRFADRLYAGLQAKGVRCWFAPHDMRSGKKIHEQIDEAIQKYDRLLLILSTESMQSGWVKTEISKARKREIAETRRVLFPIRLCSFEVLRDWVCFDADTGKDSACEIREYLIPDFSNWTDPAPYRKAFDRLLSDLHGKPDPSSV